MVAWKEKDIGGTDQNNKHSYNGMLTRMFINSLSNEEYELWTMVQRTGSYLDPCAAEFHPRREKTRRSPVIGFGFGHQQRY